MRKIYTLTGPNGAGSSTAKFVFEELGFYILENFPAKLAKDLVEKVLVDHPETEKVLLIPRIQDASSLCVELNDYKDIELCKILLDCNKDELIHRFTLTRHVHPRTVGTKMSLEKAIDSDLELVQKLKEQADLYIDTSKTTIKEFRTILYNKIEFDYQKNGITTVSFVSFGIKNGVQKDIDMMVDCRALPNPYWIESLKEKNGLDKEIKEYLNSFKETHEFLNNTIAYLEYHLNQMQKMGRGYYVVGVICSGGQHRSTFVADYLANYFKEKYKTLAFHRDCPELNK